MASTDHWWKGWARIWNTVSNLAYPATGAVVALKLATPTAWAYTAAKLVLGLGSGWYHWKRSVRSQRADWFGMMCVLAAVDTVAAAGVGLTVHWWMLGVGLGAAALLIYVFKQVGADAVLGIGVFLAVLPPFWRGLVPALLALAALALFLLAKVAHNDDRHGGARFGVYGHTIWHLLTSPAFDLLFLANVWGR